MCRGCGEVKRIVKKGVEKGEGKCVGVWESCGKMGGEVLGVWESVLEVSSECVECKEALQEVWGSVEGGVGKCGRGVEKCVGLR